MRRSLLGLALAGCFLSSPLLATYSYYVTDNLQSSNDPIWHINGSGSNSQAAGLTITSNAGASYITGGTPPDGTNQYEVAATLTLPSSGGNYVIFLEATSNAVLGSTSVGSFYAFAIQNPTFANNGCSATATLYKVVNGSVSQISSTTVPCGPTETYHAVLGNDSALHFWVNGLEYITWTDPQPLSGAGGVGGYGMPTGNGISLAQIGPCDRIAPGTIDPSSAQTYIVSGNVSLETAGVTDDANGSGVMGYRWSREWCLRRDHLNPGTRRRRRQRGNNPRLHGASAGSPRQSRFCHQPKHSRSGFLGGRSTAGRRPADRLLLGRKRRTDRHALGQSELFLVPDSGARTRLDRAGRDHLQRPELATRHRGQAMEAGRGRRLRLRLETAARLPDAVLFLFIQHRVLRIQRRHRRNLPSRSKQRRDLDLKRKRVRHL